MFFTFVVKAKDRAHMHRNYGVVTRAMGGNSLATIMVGGTGGHGLQCKDHSCPQFSFICVLLQLTGELNQV